MVTVPDRVGFDSERVMLECYRKHGLPCMEMAILETRIFFLKNPK